MSDTNKKTNIILLLITIFAISINLRPAITSIGPMLETIRDQLSLSNAQVSLLTAVPVIGMGIFAMLSPILNRLFGLKQTMYVMLLLIGLMTALRGFISGYFILLSTALIVGIAIAIVGPLLSAMIKQNFPDRAASVIGVYSFGMGVGSAASAGLTAVFYESTKSYQFALSIWSVLAIIGLLCWFLTMRGYAEVRLKNANDKIGSSKKSVSPWNSKKAWLFLLFFGLQSSAFFSIITWLAPIAIASGMSLLQAGTLLSVMTTVQIFLNILIPLAMERFGSRRFWLLLMVISGMISIVCFWTGIYPLMWVGAFIMGIPLGGLFPVALLLPLDETENAQDANAWTAMMQTGGFVMGGLLPLVIALVYDYTADHHLTFIIMMSLYVMMLILSFLIENKKQEVAT
ncbi:CynX/NimT family MFS transporter [Sporosarcina ureilytica]|uniref:MFS transporter n=1 Tax=Sporosarcina ureilytica TaxID=298596 RepID=A0A1D8JG60_9BACL|nr:MFS transporter [Sporosarcina ureilytica]AOV07709.1 MFS transporter [Sporosarcina ureilytica]